MFFYISASSKDKNVLKKFSSFRSKIETSLLTWKHFSRHKKRKFITILKSPHVNKTAQEQFEFRFYKKQFLVNSLKPLTFLLFLKKIKNLSFSGLNLEIKGVVNPQERTTYFLRSMDPDNLILENYLNKTKKMTSFNDVFVKEYIQLFDCYGEIYLKDIALRNGAV